ncbi:hypothetical protein [Rossellomorea aquimaris]|uniref:hypothetical protein n=1 Tax=Rossellomorea aquimaris TaxID=189382 RepID=UPI0011E8F848|nr:hypothetical protein [Rossellomorea aquimaris]TYS87512.1 hypothetical protein FZC88_16080 [Rossellomorea aquimaris]
MEYINEMWKFLGQVSIVIAIITFLLKTYFKGFIGQIFKKEIESYKHELNLYTEEQKFDYQRKLHDFNLYRSKRHESYKELYKLALSSLRSLKKSQREEVWPNFDKITFGEVEVYVRSEVSDEYTVTKTLSDFERYRDVSLLKTAIKGYKLKKTFITINEFEEYFKENELYYSEEINELVVSILPTLEEIGKLISVQSLAKESVELDLKTEENVFKERLNKLDDDIKNLEHSIERVKNQIIKELSIGQYEEIN